jgi:uncharacterized membrane protein YesL
MAFWITYDHLGKLILANLLVSLVVSILGGVAFAGLAYGDPVVRLTLGAPATILCFGVVLPISFAGLCHMAKQLIDERDGSFKDFFTGMGLYWRRALGIGMLYLIATTSLGTSAWFYAAKLRDSAPWLGYALSAVALWGLVFLALSAPLVMPTLVQKKGGLGETLKLTAMLVADNPLLAAGLAIQVFATTGLSIPVPPLFFLLSLGFVAVLGTTTYEMLARRYALASGSGEAPQPRAPSRASLMAELAKQDEQDDYLNRGFRDFLFPWKG